MNRLPIARSFSSIENGGEIIFKNNAQICTVFPIYLNKLINSCRSVFDRTRFMFPYSFFYGPSAVQLTSARKQDSVRIISQMFINLYSPHSEL